MRASGFDHQRDGRGRPRSSVGKCREPECQRPLFWVTMPSGKRNALNLEQLPGDPPADVLVITARRGDQRWTLGVTLQHEDLVAEAELLVQELHSSHFADPRCPGNAARLAAEAARRVVGRD